MLELIINAIFKMPKAKKLAEEVVETPWIINESEASVEQTDNSARIAAISKYIDEHPDMSDEKRAELDAKLESLNS